MAEQSTRPTQSARGRRLAWLTIGWIFVGIGFVGIFVPLLPTTDFMLLALPCFARSSPRLEDWLLEHPRFGPSLAAWRREKAVPRHAKFLASAGMILGFGFFLWSVRPGTIPALAVAGVLLLCTGWIWSRPTPAKTL